MFFLWRIREVDTTCLQFAIGLLDVVAHEGHVHKRPDAVLLLIGRKQHDACFGFGYPQFNPALFIVEWLISDNGEAEFLRVEV